MGRGRTILFTLCVCCYICATNISLVLRLQPLVEDTAARVNFDQDLAAAPDSDSGQITSKAKAENLRHAASAGHISKHASLAINNTFKRYEDVVIVTKVLWEKDIIPLKQWICLLNHAYNDRMKYDVVVFTTTPWNTDKIIELQKAAAPANLTVAVEGPPLEEQLSGMSDDERDFLRKRCNVKNETEKLTWFHHCTEPGSRHVNNLGYSWQAEFRAYHIWNHPAIKKYKFMMWLDVDAIVGKHWDVDPMKAMVENDLTLLYAGWPYGRISNDHNVKEKLIAAYGTSICGVKRYLNNGTHLHAQVCKDKAANIFQIAGNHHITNLEVFRKDIHQNFLKNFTGDHRFSRKADDQLAVTIVGLMEQYLVNNRTENEAPKISTMWHERTHGMTLNIAHHGMYDVQRKEKTKRRAHALYNHIKGNWTGLEDRCGAIMTGKA